jgi:hypothetical protein
MLEKLPPETFRFLPSCCALVEKFLHNHFWHGIVTTADVDPYPNNNTGYGTVSDQSFGTLWMRMQIYNSDSNFLAPFGITVRT